MSEEENDHLVHYGDERISSYHGTVPSWLRVQYALWIIVGILWFILYWNGSWGYLDRGYWQQLQRAANTTFPQLEDKGAPPKNNEKSEGIYGSK